MRNPYVFLLFLSFALFSKNAFAQGPGLLISGYYANPSGNDNNKEFVELLATRNLNFATTNYCVVFADAGASPAGWAEGNSATYAINITGGTLAKGGKLYVGGNLAGTFLSGGSACITNLVNTSNAGATFGNSAFGAAGASNGILGNGGGNADGVAIFNSAASSVTNSSVPVDVIFFGSAAGSASGGFTVANNDRYNTAQGKFNMGTNTYLAPDPGGDVFIAATGSIDAASGLFINARTWATATVNTSNQRSCTAPSGIVLTAANNLSLQPDSTTTTPFLAPPNISGVLADTTDPAAKSGINFSVQDNGMPVGAADYTLSVASSNGAVVPLSGVTITKTAGNANVKIAPSGVGFSALTITLTKSGQTQSYTLNYAASAATTATTVSHTGYADASAALALPGNYMLTVDDENNTFSVYDRSSSGLPAKSFAYGSLLALTDLSGGVPRETDAEGLAFSPTNSSRFYAIGSMSNQSNPPFNARPNRDRIFATDITGTGSNASFSFVGYYAGLRNDLINWGTANNLGLAASAAANNDPKEATGFNIEGMAFAPDGTTLYVGFRAPLLPATNRINALIAPLQNFETWFNGGNPAGSPAFGAPVLMDLAGRGIREIVRQNAGTLLIVAGDVGSGTLSSQIYRWNGVAANAPVLLSGFNATGLNPEGLLNVFSGGVLQTNKLQLISDNGETEYYGNGVAAKDLGTPGFKKFRSDVLTAPGQPLPVRFTQFSAVLTKANTVLVEWRFGASEDLKEFVLERSADGAQFDSIATVEAEDKMGHYAYTDARLPAETKGIQALYYRVRAVDKSGEHIYTNIRQVALRPAFASLTVYPNPVSEDFLRVTVSGSAPLPYRIFGMNGKTLLEGILRPGKNSVEVAHLRAGSYLLQVAGSGQEPVRFVRQ